MDFRPKCIDIEKTVHGAMSIKKDLNEREISAGKNPMSLTATVLYLACIMSGAL
jgi:transcription initiation factor TFIIIB Brf1 subunit/transcription initiation factor TFIIB